jgi:tRNA-modifying protein YgfZ
VAATLTIFDLSGRGRIAVSGPEAPEFLQNQLTCDVREISDASAEVEGRAGLGALCTNKGRVVVAFTLFRHAGDYVLAMPASVTARSLDHFTRAIFRSKVAVSDAAESVGAFGVLGDGADERLREAGLAVPAAAFGTTAAGGITVIRYPGMTTPRFELYGAPEALAAFRAESVGDADAAGPWVLEEIESGLPWIEEATAGQFLPQFLDMDTRGGLSFTKGCFPGQEVVARTQHLGEVKRRMFLARCDADPAPLPGTPLRTVHDTGDREGGAVVRAARTPDGDTRLLVVVPVAERTAGHEIRLASAAGPELDLEDLS